MTSDTPTPEPERDSDLAALEDSERELAALESDLDTIEGTEGADSGTRED